MTHTDLRIGDRIVTRSGVMGVVKTIDANHLILTLASGKDGFVGEYEWDCFSIIQRATQQAQEARQ